MENYSHQSYPDSGDSSPLSREIDSDNTSSWDEPPGANYKVKFMCSYGGKIQPRSHDNQLSYVGGDTKILSIDRSTTFSTVLPKLSSMCNAEPTSDICFKYQLPGEDLDALISVTNDEDLEHMMLEYDRLNRSSPKPARLRIFLFTPNSMPNSDEYQFKESKPDGSWFVDALNSAQYRPVDTPSPPTPANSEPSNPDFLFGFDKAVNTNVGEPNPNSSNNASDVNVQVPVTDSVASIQSQMDRTRIGDGEMQKLYEDQANRAQIYQSEYYNVQENKVPPPPQQAVPVTMSPGYWQERQFVAGNYPVASGIPADQQPFYVIQTPAGGVYHQNPSVRQVTGAPPGTGQAYYSVQSAYNAGPPPPPPSSFHQPKVTAAVDSSVRQAPGMVTTEQGYTQVGYDNVGRPVYYTMAGGGLAPPPLQPQYQMVTTAGGAVVDGRAVGGVGMGVDGQVVSGRAPQT